MDTILLFSKYSSIDSDLFSLHNAKCERSSLISIAANLMTFLQGAEGNFPLTGSFERRQTILRYVAYFPTAAVGEDTVEEARGSFPVVE